MIEYTAYQIYCDKQYAETFPATEDGEETNGRLTLSISEDFTHFQLRVGDELVLGSDMNVSQHNGSMEYCPRFTVVLDNVWSKCSKLKEDIISLVLETNPISESLEFAALTVKGERAFELFLKPDGLDITPPDQDSVIH